MISYHELAKAIRANDIETVKTLIQQGVELHPRGVLPPLAEAARLGNLNIMQLLIEGGANVNFQEEEDRDTALMEAVVAGNLDAVKMLVEAGADVNIRDCYQDYALSMAARNAHEEVFKYLEPLSIPKWEFGTRVLEEAKQSKRRRNIKGVWGDVSEI